ncbi:hypothetical protein PHJA_002283100 [Phtheirospermum japonicum]|uniref:Uncharacterized protein n=1 Tax=Phtheirospermum japonicum TaxID=374723 RepID=A0A830D4S2_9LAMI|nr:hypothetical protein PHJA_002283100 [Phtheirospermum japonicum]
MDSSKILEECSSSESGWTMYIASPDHEHDDDDDDDDGGDDVSVHKRKKDDFGDVYSDDSMASDASSGPSDQKQHLYRGAGKRDEITYVDKKKYNNQQHDEDDEKINKNRDEPKKIEKSRHGPNSAVGRSKKM